MGAIVEAGSHAEWRVGRSVTRRHPNKAYWVPCQIRWLHAVSTCVLHLFHSLAGADLRITSRPLELGGKRSIACHVCVTTLARSVTANAQWLVNLQSATSGNLKHISTAVGGLPLVCAGNKFGSIFQCPRFPVPEWWRSRGLGASPVLAYSGNKTDVVKKTWVRNFYRHR